MEEADGIIAEFKVSITWGEKSYIQSIFSEVKNILLKAKSMHTRNSTAAWEVEDTKTA